MSLAVIHQRARGDALVSFKQRGDATVLDSLRQVGCLKVRFPRREPGCWTSAVTLNSSGGVAGGDILATAIVAGPGTCATIASQAAERFYRALPGSVSSVANTVRVAAASTVEWLPQETILFDGAALRRELRVELAGDASFLGLESIVFGRTAMGETVRQAEVDDLIELRRDGTLLLHDRIRMSGLLAQRLSRRAVAAGSCAVATLIHAAPEAASRIDAVREALAPFDAGASAWDGMLIARIVAENGACLRRAVVAGLDVLREARPLPRVWLC